MPQKPPYRSPKQNPWRPPERRAVTIAVGYYFNGGIILAADTQETVGTHKTWTPKLIVEPREIIGKDSIDDLMLIAVLFTICLEQCFLYQEKSFITKSLLERQLIEVSAVVASVGDEISADSI